MGRAFAVLGQLVQRDLDGIVSKRGTFRAYRGDSQSRSGQYIKASVDYADVDGAAFQTCLEERQQLLAEKAELEQQLRSLGFGHLLDDQPGSAAG